uniref:Uncharacterized protein n=1 Tax=Setaria digitata TaxID=48799 RepID=A0A915PNP3_9BILA
MPFFFLQIADPLPKSNYVQDGKVHFERLGPLNEELEFRRDRIPPQLPTLLSKKGLLARLSMRNEHHELVPDNAAEIVDVPEQEYKDYKDANKIGLILYFEGKISVKYHGREKQNDWENRLKERKNAWDSVCYEAILDI